MQSVVGSLTNYTAASFLPPMSAVEVIESEPQGWKLLTVRLSATGINAGGQVQILDTFRHK